MELSLYRVNQALGRSSCPKSATQLFLASAINSQYRSDTCAMQDPFVVRFFL